MFEGSLIGDEEAEDTAEAVFAEIRERFGTVPNFFKAQAERDPHWLELNWKRWKHIMGRQGELDRETKELIALAVSIMNGCEYCSNAHEAMALQSGVSEAGIAELKQVVELFASFTRIADSLDVPVDMRPEDVCDGAD